MNKYFPPVSRTHDIESSKSAEQEINRSGVRLTQQVILFDLVKSNPGLTSREMTMHCDLDRYQIARRLSDLENGGAVEKGPIRYCRLGNRPAATWRLKNHTDMTYYDT